MTALIDKSVVMYTSGMPGPPDVPDEMKIFEARNSLAAVIDKSRYFGGTTFLMNRGKRVAAIVPVELAEVAAEFGDFDVLIAHLRSTLEGLRCPEEDPESGR